MKGTQTIDIKSDCYTYHIELTRKITIISGNSGTGKTTLIKDLLRASSSYKDSVTSSVPVYALTDETPVELALLGIGAQTNSIVCLDEGNLANINTELASAINKSNNYFLLVTREILAGVPYSPSSIKILDTDKNNHHTLKPKYSAAGNTKAVISKPDIIICEDEASGYPFFSLFATQEGTVLTAKGKDNIYGLAKQISEQNPSKQILIIADGCAFGSCLYKEMLAHQRNPKISLYLPESFEYVLLHSPIFDRDPIVQVILSDPISSIDSSFISGEQYFTYTIKSAMKRLGQTYNKSKLNHCFYDLCCYKGKDCIGKVKNRSVTKQSEILNRIGKLDTSNL